MWPDWSNPAPLGLKSDALSTELRGPEKFDSNICEIIMLIFIKRMCGGTLASTFYYLGALSAGMRCLQLLTCTM